LLSIEKLQVHWKYVFKLCYEPWEHMFSQKKRQISQSQHPNTKPLA
jgi:hypothetical protein